MNEQEVLEARQYFSAVGVWPPQPTGIKPVQWLDNFPDPGERRFAVALLESFMFVNNQMTQQLFLSAFHNLCGEVFGHANTGPEMVAAWRAFRSRVWISFPTGESPNATDSGLTFARMARMQLLLDEGQIVAPDQLTQLLADQGAVRPVVFVDDFAGSGDQFIATWQRQYELRDGSSASLEDVCSVNTGLQVFYTPAICTWIARDAIASAAPIVRLRPAHLLAERYSAASPDSILVPQELVPDLHQFIVDSSLRAGIPRTRAFGYQGLGLALAFEHSVPDATLPIFWTESPGWVPLRRRR